MALRLESHQAKRLEKLAEQCGLTPEQMASTIAVLALNRQLGEPQIPASQPTEQSTSKRLAAESILGASAGYSLPDTGFLHLTEIVGRPAKRGQPAQPRLVPISRSTWLAGVKSGIFPQPVNLGGG